MQIWTLSLVACLAHALAEGVTGLESSRAAANAAQMRRLMESKLAERAEQKAAGLFAGSDRYKSYDSLQRCTNGFAGSGDNNTYSCNNVDLYSFLPHDKIGSVTMEGNDIWGWTSPDGREFAAVGHTDGTGFVEILPTGKMRWLGRLPTQTVPSTWRDMKVIGSHVYVGSEAKDHGLQIFDMRRLLTVTEPLQFDMKTEVTAWFGGFGSSHNIVAHEETKMIYAVGTARKSSCAGGLYMVDVSDPTKPVDKGCASQDGYTHDAQCVVYRGPDKKYTGKEICFGYNEDTLTVWDVTNKTAPAIISKTAYVGSAYTHQGWLLDDEQDMLLMDDELDERDGTNPGRRNHTTTYIWDVSALGAPKQTGIYQSPVQSIDHNQYIHNGLAYQSNYASGLRIIDVSSKDPTGAKFKEVGFFDCHPEDDAQGGSVQFSGSWSVYPYFKSGFIVLNSIERGVYVLKYTG